MTKASPLCKQRPGATPPETDAPRPRGGVRADDLEGWTSDYRSIPWLTYRSGFRAMEPYSYTDDAGWGCMLVRPGGSRLIGGGEEEGDDVIDSR